MTKQSVLFCILAAFALGAAAQAQTSNVSSKEVAAQSQAEPVMGPAQEYSTTLSLFPLPSPVSLAPKNAEAPLFTYGLDERVRTEDWNNLMDYSDGANDEHKQLRIRTRLWGGLSTPHSEIQFNFKLNNEIKKAIYINIAAVQPGNGLYPWKGYLASYQKIARTLVKTYGANDLLIACKKAIGFE